MQFLKKEAQEIMFDPLNASNYEYSGIFYNAEFERILSKFIYCYNLMLSDNVLLKNNENLIRDSLLINYLKNNAIREKAQLTDYLFDREVPEDNTIGRTDIKIQTKNTFQDTSAYYTIECKRLDSKNPTGKGGLNGMYITNGICRFTSKSYSTHNNTNGMLGFITQEIDISQNVKSINNLLIKTFKEANTTSELSLKEIVPDFSFSYSSRHKVDDIEIIIYHLMLDFSKNIQ